MYRAFLSLYFLIVASVIAVGWGLDKLWEHYSREPVATAAEQDLLALLEAELSAVEPDRIQPYRQLLDEQVQASVELFPLDDLASSTLGQAIRVGEMVVVDTRGGERILYKLMGQSDQVLSVRSIGSESERSLFYDLFVVLFYGSIALVVFFWVWPLSRDLRRLEKHTRVLGKEPAAADLVVGPASPVYDLTMAFNGMAKRIKSLLASHKEMTYAVSHELRTPLARMKFGLEMAIDCESLPKVKQQLAGVRQDVSEMDALVNELLAYASFEQKDQSLDCQPGDMQSLIEELMARLASSEACAGKSFTFACTAPSPRVWCEWYLMERAVINLLQNGARFAKTHVQVTLALHNGLHVLHVDDDGPGIPEADRERVFNSFVRLNTDTNAKSRGFGLGLAIVKRIAEWHRGSATASQSPLGGAKITVSWPAQTVAAPT